MKTLQKIIIFSSLINIGIFNPCVAQFRSDRPTFFEDGQRLMEQEIRRLEQQRNAGDLNQQNTEHPAQLLTIDDGKLRWEKYIFRDAGFSVWMPQGIQSNEIVTIETGRGNLDFEVFATHPKSLRFIAAYSASENLAKFANSEEILTAVKEGIIAKTSFELLEEKSIDKADFQGQALQMKSEQEIIYFNVYVVNNKVYVLAVGARNGGYEDDINSFFDSFRLLIGNK